MQKLFETSDGAVLAYSDDGVGEINIFLSGWSQSAKMFHNQIDYFSAKYRNIALDFRGHGMSPNAENGYRIHRFAADVAELLDALSISRCNLIGSSMGCSVIWAFIDLYGLRRVDRLVFIDEPASVMRQATMSDQDARDAGALFDAGTMVALAEQIAGPQGHAARTAFLDSMVTKSIASELKAFILKENLRADPAHVAALFVNHCSIDWRDVFRRIDRPTLIVGGRASHVDPRSQEWIHDQIPHSSLMIFDEEQGGAHFPFLEGPDHFNPVLERFLSSGEIEAAGTSAR